MSQTHETLVSLPDGSTQAFIHRGSHADLGVIEQIFKNRDYALETLRRCEEFDQKFRALTAAEKKPLIVDCGANIGASACWFAAAFPGSHVVCFEPDGANFQLLQTNTKSLDAELHMAAIAAIDGVAALVDPGEGEWGYRTRQSETGDIPVMSLNRLVNCKKSTGYVPFIVKIDIEGGEKELFSEQTSWIDEFPILIIELHDWLLPKMRTSQSFIKAIAGHDRDFVYAGENIFSLKNE